MGQTIGLRRILPHALVVRGSRGVRRSWAWDLGMRQNANVWWFIPLSFHPPPLFRWLWSPLALSAPHKSLFYLLRNSGRHWTSLFVPTSSPEMGKRGSFPHAHRKMCSFIFSKQMNETNNSRPIWCRRAADSQQRDLWFRRSIPKLFENLDIASALGQRPPFTQPAQTLWSCTDYLLKRNVIMLVQEWKAISDHA